MSDSRPIGVFDSGLGGLTVVRELIKVMPNEDIVYFGDTGRVPYGTRSRETIIKYTRQDESFLLSRGVKLIIAACGTVSSVAAETGDELPVPFIEVVSHASRRAAEETMNGKVGVIATPATIASGSYKKRIEAINSEIQVYGNECPLFVPIVEAGWIDRNDAVAIETAKRYLAPLKEKGVDTLILGCTHYPVITDIIRDVMGNGVKLINPGEHTAKAAKKYIEENSLQNEKNEQGKHQYFVSDRTESFSKTASILMGHPIKESVTRVDIDNIKELF